MTSQAEGGYIEVRIEAPVDPGELLGMLRDDNSLGAWEEDGIVHLYWPERLWNTDAVAELSATLRTLGISDPESAMRCAIVPEQDWNVRWAESVKPVRIGRRILIRQSWNRGDVPEGGIELIIDPKRAFGTGYHATTQLVIEWLESAVRGGERVLDVGTGSGILAMVALRLGAALALGIDTDPIAIECARENAALNGYGDELRFSQNALQDLVAGPFDCILANLDRGTLLSLAGKVKPFLGRDGRLVVTGLQADDETEIVDEFRLAGATFSARFEREEWLALEFRFSPRHADH
jgi:ribosomal protein L11 methyltransferase